MRVLFVVPPLAGHVNPTVAVAAELTARGHEVAWTGPAKVLAPMLPPGSRLLPSGDGTGAVPGSDSGDYAALHEQWRDLRGVAALRFLWEEALIPLAHAMLPGVAAAVDAYAPDVLVADQQALAGAIVARRRGLRWVTSATTSAELTAPFAGFPKVGKWVAGRIAALLADCGAPGGWDPRFSDRLVLVFSTPELLGERQSGAYPEHYAFVGPAFGARPAAGDFPWQRLDPGRRRVLVSLGTLNREAGGRFYAAMLVAAERLADRVQVILAAPAELVGEVPEHVLLQEFIPQLRLLPHLDAVVCHGGHNTVCEALAHGLPLVVAPIRDDQPIVAQQVTASGAGVRTRFGRARADELHAALTAVLFGNPGHRRAARRVQASFAAAGGAAAAADRLEKLI
ncbi:glycosyltransferase [Streptomyces gobiensis]|uniref:glycosyltransferase n=1 Tax=Streptomyces gobiensis TaxID=2875706 RepID=UPI001E58ED4D|nr:glycosyltransferase [Streptomyces gobiensis]UGY94918.1 glycosyltransferase [Streptomyces gobiensis]